MIMVKLDQVTSASSKGHQYSSCMIKFSIIRLELLACLKNLNDQSFQDITAVKFIRVRLVDALWVLATTASQFAAEGGSAST
jgi:hypothetical protein